MERRMIAGLLLLFAMTAAWAAGAAERAAEAMTAGSSGAQLYPLTGHRALAVQFSDSGQKIELFLADASGVQKSVRIPYDERDDFGFIPSSHEEPEFWLYDASENVMTWYAWKDDTLLPLLQREGWSSLIAKEEGLVLENDQYGSFVESLEFIDSQQQTLFRMPISLPNTVFEDVIWDEMGWILLSREISVTNLYTVWRISRDGEILWTREFPEIKSADGFFTDGAGGLWMAYSPSYTGAMSLFHIDSDGAVDREILFGGEPRVKYLYGSQTVTQGEVTVYGTSVAHSKGIYHAFALTLSSSGDVLGLDVRNYTERKDYGIEIRQAADGTVYVYSGSYENAAPLLAPFAGLQAVMDHGLEVAQ